MTSSRVFPTSEGHGGGLGLAEFFRRLEFDSELSKCLEVNPSLIFHILKLLHYCLLLQICSLPNQLPLLKQLCPLTLDKLSFLVILMNPAEGDLLLILLHLRNLPYVVLSLPSLEQFPLPFEELVPLLLPLDLVHVFISLLQLR